MRSRPVEALADLVGSHLPIDKDQKQRILEALELRTRLRTVIDLLKRRILSFASVKVLVLDEADRMLDMGFIDDIEYILSRVPSNRQTSLFSATIDQSVLRVCNRYMRNPEKILVSKAENKSK